MRTPSTSDLPTSTEEGGVYPRVLAWVKARWLLLVSAVTAIAVLAAAVPFLLPMLDMSGNPSWTIGATRDGTKLSAADVRSLDQRLAALKPGTVGFAERADEHLKLLSTLKLINGRGGPTLDQHLLRFISATRAEIAQGDGSVGYEFAEQAFGLIDGPAERQIAAQRLGLFTASGRLTPQNRLERLFRTWAMVDRACLDVGRNCDALTRDFAIYFAAHASISTDARQAAFLLARRIGDPNRRVQAYREVGTLIMRPTIRTQTDLALFAAANAALKNKQAKTAVATAAALSVRSDRSRDGMLRLVTDTLLKNDDILDSLDAGLAISDAPLRDAALLRVINVGSNKGFMHEAQVAQTRIEGSDQRVMANALIGLAFAKAGYLTQAQPYLNGLSSAVATIPEGALRQSAAAYGAHALAESGNLEEATKLLAVTDSDNPLRDDALRSISGLYARAQNVQGLVDLAETTRGTLAGDMLGRAAAMALRSGDPAAAENIVAQAPDDGAWLHAAGRLALAGYTSKAWVADARSRFAGLPTTNPDLADSMAFADTALTNAQGNVTLAARRLPLIADPALRADVAKAVGTMLVRHGDYPKAIKLLGVFTPADALNRDAVKASLSLDLGKAGAIRAAAYTARTMSDVDSRVRTFRALARAQAERLDRFDALKGAEQFAAPDANRAIKPSPEVERYTYATFDVQQQKLGDFLPRLPNSDTIEGATIRGALPPTDNSAQLDIVPLVNNDYNKKFLTARSVQDDWTLIGATIVMAAQSTRHPVYLHLSQGRLSLPQLWEQLVLRGQGQYLLRRGRTYTLRAPLFVADGATMTLSGGDVSTLRLSTERASFLVNGGDMRIADVTLVAWNEASKMPTPLTYETRQNFRPFYIAWSNSATRAVGSHFLNLGYAAGKAYGMTLTYGPVTLLQRNVEQIRPPTGTFVENSFQNMLYGFYSYEANDVQVVGNEYRDNIVYGIDPHDRSHKLLFSYNTVYGSHKKHGIIGSRNVEDSWFLGNLTFDNKGSGMMMDRYAGRNIMYANTAFDNHSNGISIYESPCNIISSNNVFNNGRSGITVRNSWDVGIFHNGIRDNRNLGIEGYAVEFVTKPGQPTRNLLLDPYERFLSTEAVSNRMKNNGQGGVGMTGMGAMLLQGNIQVGQSKRVFLNDLKLAERDLGAHQAGGVIVASSCPRPRRPYSCPFIQQNYLSAEVGAASFGGRQLASCPGNTIVNAATQQSTPAFAPDRERDEQDGDNDPLTPRGGL